MYGSASAGVVTVGGLRGAASAIPIGSQGDIAVVRFRVLAGSSQTTQINMNSLTDDLVGMTSSPNSVTFTRN